MVPGKILRQEINIRILMLYMRRLQPTFKDAFPLIKSRPANKTNCPHEHDMLLSQNKGILFPPRYQGGEEMGKNLTTPMLNILFSKKLKNFFPSFKPVQVSWAN